MKYYLTRHALTAIKEREISVQWIETVLLQPLRVEQDSVDVSLEHRLARIKEFENRVLRVIVVKDASPLRIVSAYFDRSMRKKL